MHFNMLMMYFIHNIVNKIHNHNIKVHLLVVYMLLGLINAWKMKHIRKTEISRSDRHNLTATGPYLTKYRRSFQK